MPPPTVNAPDRLIVALDLPSIHDARALVEKLHGVVSFFKIGLTLQLADGVGAFIQELLQQGKRVFLDYKYLDVEETMRKAVARAASLGVTFLTIHGNGSIVQAAVRGRGESALKILSVTVLTSLDANDIRELGFQCSVEELVLHRAQKSIEAGCDGVVASGREARRIRELAGSRPWRIVAPGIRPKEAPGGQKQDEQKRAVSPGEAIRNGADYLVVGRPIYGHPDPKASAGSIAQEM